MANQTKELSQKLDDIRIGARCAQFAEDAKIAAMVSKMFYDEFVKAGFTEDQALKLLLKVPMEVTLDEDGEEDNED